MATVAGSLLVKLIKKITIKSKKLCKCSTLQERGKNWKKVGRGAGGAAGILSGTFGSIALALIYHLVIINHHQSSSTISDHHQLQLERAQVETFKSIKIEIY